MVAGHARRYVNDVKISVWGITEPRIVGKVTVYRFLYPDTTHPITEFVAVQTAAIQICQTCTSATYGFTAYGERNYRLTDDDVGFSILALNVDGRPVRICTGTGITIKCTLRDRWIRTLLNYQTCTKIDRLVTIEYAFRNLR
jgi:hypothetical protein